MAPPHVNVEEDPLQMVEGLAFMVTLGGVLTVIVMAELIAVGVLAHEELLVNKQVTSSLFDKPALL